MIDLIEYCRKGKPAIEDECDMKFGNDITITTPRKNWSREYIPANTTKSHNSSIIRWTMEDDEEKTEEYSYEYDKRYGVYVRKWNKSLEPIKFDVE